MDRYAFKVRQYSSRRLQRCRKNFVLLPVEKKPESSDSDLTCYVFSLVEAVEYMAVSASGRILTKEKEFYGPLGAINCLLVNHFL